MPLWFIGLALLSSAPAIAPQGEDPRAVVRAATSAIEADQAARARTRWRSRLARQPNDRSVLLGLATLARLQYGYPAADSIYRALVAGPVDRVSIYAHLGLAEGLEARSTSDDSRPALERAREAARNLHDPVAEGESLVLLALVRGRLEGPPVAQALLDTAARLIPDTALSLRSRLRNRNATVHALLGRPSEARASANAAIELGRRAGDLRAEAEAWRVLGQVLLLRGQLDSALGALRESQDRYVRARSRSELAGSLVWHAKVLASQARFGEMREVMRHALAEGQATHNLVAVADAHRSFGVAAAMLGDWPGAAAHLRRSAAISAASGDSAGAVSTLRFQGHAARAAGDLATARRYHLERLARARRIRDVLEHQTALGDLADIAREQGDFAAADTLLAEARALLRLLPGTMHRLRLLQDEARHAMARGRTGQAVQLLDSVVRGAGGAEANVIRFDARVRLADLSAWRGDVSRAERELGGATDEIERWRSTLSDLELRRLAFQATSTVRAASDPMAIESSAARVLAAMARAGRTEAAFALAERWRARALMDLLTRASTGRTERMPNGSAGSISGASPRNMREIVAAMPGRRVALLEYVAAPDAPITVFIVQQNGVQAVVLPPVDSLAELVSRFRALLEGGGDPSRLARALGAALLDSALSRLDADVTGILIVPDGPLHRLAFDATRLPDGRFLLERYAVGLAPSASAWATLRAHRRTEEPAAPLRLLALGDPRIRADARRNGERPDDGRPAAAWAAGELPRLPGAAREARLVARYAPAAEVRLGADASAAFLKAADLRRYRVLHFATHAIVDESSTLGTALVLASGRDESGLVGVGDLAALRLNADLVVLSSCSSAGGMLTTGEGVQGLSSALLQAGARTLVATGWRTDDREVVPLVDRFYAGLARRQSVLEALHAAKLAALHSGATPRTWAAFSAVGDPLVELPLRQPPASWWASLFR